MAAWFGYLTAKKRIPIEEHTAKADAAKTLTETAMGLMKDMESRLKSVEGKVIELTAHSEKQDGEISTLRRHLDTWAAWAEGLRISWAVVRLNETPPLLPTMKEKE